MTEEREQYAVTTVDAEVRELAPINVDLAVAKWDAYQSLCRRILTEDDYALIDGKKARKRSGWRKLATFMQVSTEILHEDRWERESTFGYTFTVRASTPDGRFSDGDGLCDSTEFTGKLKGTEHNVRSKSLTRAKNRAIADHIGGGEVSAEELDNGHNGEERATRHETRTQKQASTKATQTSKQQQPTEHWIKDEAQRKGFFAWCGNKVLSVADVHQILRVEHVEDYAGTMADAQKAIMAHIGAQTAAPKSTEEQVEQDKADLFGKGAS